MKKMMKTIVPVAASVAAAVIVTVSGALAQEKPKVDDALLATGKAAYMRECAACHGVKGDGKGLGAIYVNPRPRDFTLGVYKLRSTPNGEVPTDTDLLKTITNGIPNSMMPSFRSLSLKERWALVETIKRFGGLEKESSKSVTVPAEPKVTKASITNGRKLYVKLKCAACHDAKGLGEGPSSLTLKNDAKERIFPANLTMGVYKGGASPTELYTRIATGMDGSPMPSYVKEATPTEIWDLVFFIKTLEVKK